MEVIFTALRGIYFNRPGLLFSLRLASLTARFSFSVLPTFLSFSFFGVLSAMSSCFRTRVLADQYSLTPTNLALCSLWITRWSSRCSRVSASR